ncbi:universal stress protein [bacterium]|nr:universal stress protein [bacterium]
MIDSSRKRIVWALDPFEENGPSRMAVLEVLREYGARGASIQPVYILSPSEYDINIEFNAPWLKRVRPAVQKLVEHSIKGIKIPGMLPVETIVESHSTLFQTIKTFISHAQRLRADLIVVGTHSRKGISRFFLGSFAETLLLYSKIPVLVAGSRTENQPTKGSRPILFITDFVHHSRKTFEKVVRLAKERRSKVVLFHVIPHPIEPFVKLGVYLLAGGFVTYPDFVTQEEQRKKQIADEYVQLAKKQGVTVEIYFDRGNRGTVPAVIDQAKKMKAGLIAMAAQSGPTAAAVLGSIARQVVRSAPCPVWVLRSSK